VPKETKEPPGRLPGPPTTRMGRLKQKGPYEGPEHQQGDTGTRCERPTTHHSAVVFFFRALLYKGKKSGK